MDKICKHCGAPFSGDSEFCCRGCDYVYHLIQEEGFDRYYDLKDKTLPPVGSTAFQQRDDADLIAHWNASDEISEGVVRMDLELKGISCVGCVWLIEKLFTRWDGHVRIDIDPQRGKIVLDAFRSFDIAGFASEIQRYGYTLREWSGERVSTEGLGAGSRLGICGFLAMNAMAFTLPFYLGMNGDNQFAPLLKMAVMGLSTFSVLIGGTYFFKRAWIALRLGTLHIDLPIALGISVAYIGSVVGWLTHDEALFYFDFITIFILLMLVGRWLQERVTENNIQKGFVIDPADQKVQLKTGDIDELSSVKSLKPGVSYSMVSGSWIPVQSRVVSGRASLSLESINGESDPREFVQDDVIPSGAVLLSRNEVEFEALETWSNSLLKRLFEINSTNSHEESPMEKVLKVYILVVIGMAVLGFAFWGLGSGDWRTGFQVAVSILVVSCPCAIGLAYPRVNDLCGLWLRNRGVYIRLHTIWSRLKGVKQVFFDKTGTLTLETLACTNVGVLSDMDKGLLIPLYGLVENNLHPVARSLKEHLLTYDSSLTKTGALFPATEEHIGFGVSFRWEGHHYQLSKSTDQDRLGQTVFYCDDKEIAFFEFSDSIRSDVREAVDWLENQKLRVSVISGDSPDKVDRMTVALGLPPERGIGGMSPSEKADWIDRYANEEGMMIGDGANDALAFEKARCRATPVIGRGVLENHSDFFFLGNGIGGIVDVFKLSKLRERVVREVMTITIGYNIIVVLVSLFGVMNPLLAAVLMPISSIVTVSWAGIRLAKTHLDRELS